MSQRAKRQPKAPKHLEEYELDTKMYSKTKVILGILCSNPILSTLFRDKTLEIYSGLIRQKH